MQRKFVLLILLISVVSVAQAQEINFSKLIGQVSAHGKFRLDSFMVWCGSMVKGEDKKYYLFYSRWPRRLGHQAWATHSEVALAVADHPEGPYQHLSVILPKRDKQYWDADVTHNPTIHKFGDTYYLYYMGNYGNGEWWNHRNNQRIGLATAKSPLGPWTRSATPLVDTTANGFDHVIASNPSVMKRLDGKYQMIYKGVSKGPEPFGGIVTHGTAIADHPAGPFVKTAHRIFIKDSVRFAAEDPYIWAQEGKYWAIVKDMQGVFTNAGTSLALFESVDGYDWVLSKHALVSTTQIPWVTGMKKVQKLERPQLYCEGGNPAILFCAVYDGDDNYNIAIPLQRISSNNEMDELDFSRLVQPVSQQNQFIDTAFNIWCGSVIKSTNGKYYMFYSRWPKEKGHDAWVTDSEIALAIAEQPGGPYKHLKVIFKQRGNQYWDGIATHNPAVIYHAGNYYLYYMGTTGSAPIKPGFAYSPAWYDYRNHQRIGVAVANDPEGEWKRFDQPLLDAGEDSTAFDAMLVSNPAITIDDKGRVILVYKQVGKNGTFRGGSVKYGVAFSSSLLGPFKKNPAPIFIDKKNHSDKDWMQAEDPFIWHQNGTSYAIVRDVIGMFTGEEGALALFSSNDGLNWMPAKYPKVLPREVYDENGKKFDDKLERPWLLIENGIPQYLFGAMGIEKRNHSMNVAIPLHKKDQ